MNNLTYHTQVASLTMDQAGKELQTGLQTVSLHYQVYAYTEQMFENLCPKLK